MRDDATLLHPTLRRYADPPTLRIARYVAAGAACGFAGIALALALLRLADARSSTARQASIEAERTQFAAQAKDKLLADYIVRDYALTAFPAWVADHPDQACPASVDDLAPHATPGTSIDPWGTPLQVRCPRSVAEITSAGPDRLFGTDDDIRSPR